MLKLLRRYVHWLHTGWPAGTVEKLPVVREDGSTNVAGVYVVGDLAGVPLLKFAADGGARAVQTIVADPSFRSAAARAVDGVMDMLDLAIVGGGVAGMAAALEARKHGLRFEILEASEPFATIANFPRAKPIYTYPEDMTPAGDLQFTDRSSVKEGLLDELRGRTLGAGIRPRIARVECVRRRGDHVEVVVPDAAPLVARRAIIAIGRSGDFRKLGVQGEDLDKVSNRLHDPKDYCGREVLVAGGGDTAVECAVAIASCGGRVTLSYRGAVLSRPKPENLERLRALVADPRSRVDIDRPSSERVTTATGDFLGRSSEPGSLRLRLATEVREIRAHEVVLAAPGVGAGPGVLDTIPNDHVFVMIGREAPLDFMRRSGIRIRSEWTARSWGGLAICLALAFLLMHWKSSGNPIGAWFRAHHWFPFNLEPGDPRTLAGTLWTALGSAGFYYSAVYSFLVVALGVRRIRLRRTPYVTAQTLTFMAIQVIPLFLLPYLLLPWLGANGAFSSGVGRWFGDTFFPDGGYWRSFGFVLAWPLFLWNVLTDRPLWGWLVVSLVQTFVLIPVLVGYYGKGAYCGWICSCGALAETLGDPQRDKMPHGPGWNRLNAAGQAILVLTFVLLGLRVWAWAFPESGAAGVYHGALAGWPIVNYSYLVDLWLAGVLGLGLYFHLSGRVWCRFFCPLAALMHVYARFSRFRILAEKKKCISCSLCTSVCHQGIDVMSFANKGVPMSDPECVRCSACISTCPTGVLRFGQVDPRTGEVLRVDALAAARSTGKGHGA